MSTITPPNPQPGQLPPGKKPNWLLFALIGCGGLVILIGVALLAGGWFVKEKIKQAGLDPQLMQKNPALAFSKLIAAANPDLEVVSVDDSRGTITVRDKKSNKVLTVNLEEAKKGRIVFKEEGKDAVTLETTEKGVTIQSKEGSMQIGAGGRPPAWVPVFAGANPEGTFYNRSQEGEAGSFHFVTKEPPERVLSWYDAELKKAGMRTTSNAVQQDGRTTGGMANGQAPDGKRTVTVVAGSSDEGTSVTVTFNEKK